MIYLFVIGLLIFLICRFDINGKVEQRDFYYNLVFAVLTAIAGMRYMIGADTASYLYGFYHNNPYLWDLTIDDFAWDSEPLWSLINSFVLSIGCKWYVVQFIHAAFVHYFLFRYFKKHSEYIFTCVFFYFIWMYTYYVMEELRASISVVVCLYANDYFLNKKWGKGYLLLFIGCLFHKSTYVLLIVPVLIWLMQSNIVALIVVIVAFSTSYVVKSQMGDYLEFIAIGDVSESINESMRIYVNSDIYGENNGNINFFLVQIFPFLFYPLLSLYCNRNNKSILYLKPLLLIGIIFVVIRFNIEIFYRYVHFYMPYIIIFVSQLFVDIQKNTKVLSIGIAYAKAWIIFIPLFVLVGRGYLELFPRYYPYSSVIERNLPYEREKAFSSASIKYQKPQPNEY